MASDGQYAQPGLIACKIRGTAICHIQGQCKGCVFAWKHEHPDEVINVSHVGE